MSILDAIKKEHRDATAMLDEAQKLEPDDSRMADLAKRIERALTTHVEIEERLFYAQLRKRAEEHFFERLKPCIRVRVVAVDERAVNVKQNGAQRRKYHGKHIAFL